MKVWRALLVGLALALTVAACAGGGYSDNPDTYMPKDVGGKKVDTKGEFAKSLESSFKSGQVKKFASGTVGTPSQSNPLPELIILAAQGKEGGIKDAKDQLKKAFAGGKGKVKSVKIKGLDVQMLSFSQSGLSATVAIATPRKDIGLIAFSFKGGEKAATGGMEAMLDAGKK